MDSEPTTPRSPVDHIVMLRIADALERIATALESTERIPRAGTPFPWNEMSVRTNNAIRGGRMNPWPDQNWKPWKWPWTCEDLMEIGCREIMTIKNFGETSANEIADALKRLGFDDWRAT